VKPSLRVWLRTVQVVVVRAKLSTSSTPRTIRSNRISSPDRSVEEDTMIPVSTAKGMVALVPVPTASLRPSPTKEPPA
jgi:hypothetical protein